MTLKGLIKMSVLVYQVAVASAQYCHHKHLRIRKRCHAMHLRGRYIYGWGYGLKISLHIAAKATFMFSVIQTHDNAGKLPRLDT